MSDARLVAFTNDVLGEVPLWHPGERALYWIDLFKPALHRFDPASGELQSWTPPEKLGSHAFVEGGGLLIAGRSGIHLYDPMAKTYERIADPEAGDTRNLLNDGRCDSRGRFWVGSMNKMQTEATGRIYRLAGRSVEVMGDGIWVSNGLCWSPDSRRMYFADSPTREIVYYDFEPEAGVLGERHVFASTASMPGVPDGSAIDAEGYLWNAMFDGACVVRYAPDGRVDRVLATPVSRPTSCTFGGDDLSTLYVTTARFRLPPEKLATEPMAGGLIAFDVGVKGLPEFFYRP
jgi:L-arabinonolactonase